MVAVAGVLGMVVFRVVSGSGGGVFSPLPSANMPQEKKTQEKRITDITVKGTRFEVGKGVYIFRAPTDTKESALNGKKCKLTRIFSAEEFGIQMLEGGR